MSTLLTWPNKRQPTRPPSIDLRLSEMFATNGEVGGWGNEEKNCTTLSPTPYLPISPSPNLLFHADNLPTLAHLLNQGYAGKVKLIYIDPPYQSGVVWQRKVRLRGEKAITMQTAADHVFAAQTEYEDRWDEGEYLQFIYERLPLLCELLSEDGSLWLHCDHRQTHHLRCLLEEVFGVENFLNTVTWRSQTARGAKVNAFYFAASSQSIHIFAKNRKAPTVWNPPKRRILLSEAEAALQFMRDEGGFFRTSDPGSYSFASLKQLHSEGRLYAPFGGEVVIDEERQRVYSSKGGNLGVKYYLSKVGRNQWQLERAVDNLWDDIPGLGTTPGEDLGYPTQKTEALLTRIIETASNTGDLILDCFMGSGTTLAVANKLGRRWIGIDQNRGAMITTRRRLQAQSSSFAIFAEAGGVRGEEELRSVFLTPHPSIISATITRNASDPATIEVQINGYRSPTIEGQLAAGKAVEGDGDWRAIVDCVEIDPHFNGEIFRATVVDAPIKKSQQVKGTYTVQAPVAATRVAVRITDVSGHEAMHETILNE
ncbi:MAG: site-specific DNA-methyltransferase [Caldilineaceae bacterium]